MINLRGEPTHEQLIDKFKEVWEHADQPITRLISNILAAGGYSVGDYQDIFFIGIPDSELSRCIDSFKTLLIKVGEW